MACRGWIVLRFDLSRYSVWYLFKNFPVSLFFCFNLLCDPYRWSEANCFKQCFTISRCGTLLFIRELFTQQLLALIPMLNVLSSWSSSRLLDRLGFRDRPLYQSPDWMFSLQIIPCFYMIIYDNFGIITRAESPILSCHHYDMPRLFLFTKISYRLGRVFYSFGLIEKPLSD